MKYADRVKETTVTTGTGTITLGGEVSGFRTFLAALTNGDLVPYVIEAANGTDWETGIGTYSAGTLARTTITASSNAGTALNLAAGTHTVYLGLIAKNLNDQREVLTAARTYYVATTGSDSNDGLTVGAPFLTTQKAIDVVSRLDINVQSVSIQLVDGTYAENVTLKDFVGAGPVTIKGNAGTPANVVIAPSSGNAIFGQNCGYWHIQDLKITAAAGSGLYAVGGSARITFSGLDFGACSGSQIRAQSSSSIAATGNYSVSGGATAHWYCHSNASIIASERTITITGTPAFTRWAWCDRGLGMQDVYGITFVGTATGSRYTISSNGVCFTNSGGATYLPGNTVGTVTNGGVYA